LELLAGAMVKLTEHEDLSRETVRRRLEQPDPKRPVICFDESPTQIIGERTGASISIANTI
jgi:hypothetical protein